MTRLKLHWQILIALGLAVLLGLPFGRDTALFGVNLYDVCAFVGDMFLRALTMLVMPLIIASIITGLSSIGQISDAGDASASKNLGRLGLKTAIYYLMTSLSAILLGLVIVDIVQPGISDGQPVKDRIGLSADTATVTERVADRSGKDFFEVLLRMIPRNVLDDAAKNEMLGVIVFSLLFGFFMLRIPPRYGQTLTDFWQGV
jgi:Na+/H+-dicarboxylate symporter